MQLRKANINDIPILEFWDQQPHVLESDPDHDWDWHQMLKTDHDWQELLIAELNDAPIGFVQIIDPAREESHYWGDTPEGLRAIDIWIGEIQNTGKGYGTEMMKLALEKCFEPVEVTAVLIDPLSNNKRAIAFYERIGFVFVEHRQFDTDHCSVYSITREQWNRASKSYPDFNPDGTG